MLVVPRWVQGLILVALVIVLPVVPAGAAVGPLGIVDDRGGILSSGQVTAIERGLSGLPHRYTVVMERRLPKAFESSDDILAHYQTARDAILILTDVENEEAYFVAWPDGPVYQEFKTKLGVPFGSYTDDYLAAYGPEAQRKDWVAATLAVVRVIEEKVSDLPAAPAPGYSTWAWAGSLLVVTLLGVYLCRRLFVRKRAFQKRQAVNALLVAFDRDTLSRLQTRLEIAIAYEGDQSKQGAQRLGAALEATVDLDAQAHADLEKAEELWQGRRYLQAAPAFAEVAAKLDAATVQLGQAVAAWAPFQHVLEVWEDALNQAHSTFSESRVALAGQQSLRGWRLDALERTASQVPQLLSQAAAMRDADPLGAFELLSSTQGQVDTLAAHLGDLDEVCGALDQLALAHSETTTLVRRSRSDEGLLFSDESPEDPLARADQIAERTRQQYLPMGEIPRAQEALSEAQANVLKARTIVEQTMHARRALPEMLDAAEARIREIPGATSLVTGLLNQLQTGYASTHWSDLADLPFQLERLEQETSKASARGRELGGPETQRYLQAVDLLTQAQSEWNRVHERIHILKMRPNLLAERRSEVESSIRTARADLSAAVGLSARPGLIVPASMDQALRASSAQIDQLEFALNPNSLLDLGHLASRATSLRDDARRYRSEFEQLVRQAEQALAAQALARAAATAMRTASRSSSSFGSSSSSSPRSGGFKDDAGGGGGWGGKRR